METFEKDLAECLKVLEKGGLILYPTDTIWGIGCDATNRSAVARVNYLKAREPGKSLIILVAEFSQIEKYVQEIPPQIRDYVLQASGPLTVIYEGARNLPVNLIAADGSIAIRLVRDPFCEALVLGMGKPIVSTSANPSGKSTPSDFSDIRPEIIRGVDYRVCYRRGKTGQSRPSTMVRFDPSGTLQVIRP